MSEPPTSTGNSEEQPTAASGPGPEGDTLAEKPGSVLGPYRLVRLLGQGGFGTVFLAEQDAPIRREVALKIVKLGMDTREVIARFDAERQTLARMDHPNIARVYDAGATATGRPYFVMELVRGVPITQYCETHDLTLEGRLRLFVQVCAAVQHAHQKGIIHRDIKPSNILVAEHEGAPSPKVIDFGIAKATEQDLDQRSVFTAMGQVIGTPSYMSPEQAGLGNLDVDTRSDVYSLGVLLYELLTGTVPFDTSTLRGAFWLELQRMIREQEPPRPSARAMSIKTSQSSASRRRFPDSEKLGSLLRGDLDWIVMKALEKDRARRYESARELAVDVERHMRDEPVTAGPPSASYRVGKFVRRHKAGVGAAIAAVLVLAAFGATMAVQARRIAVERDRANREREISDSVADFQTSMLQHIRPYDMGRSIVTDLRGGLEERLAGAEKQAALASFDGLLDGVNPTDTARRVLDSQILRPAADAVTEQFAEQPETEARMRLALARTYRAIGLSAQGLPQAERAVAVSEKTFGPDDRQTLLARQAQAIALWDLGRMDECEKVLGPLPATWDRVYGPDDPDGIRSHIALGVLYMGRDRTADARKLFEGAIDAIGRTQGPDSKDLLNPLGNLATLLLNEAQYAQATPVLERALAIQKKLAGAEDPQTLVTQQRLAEVYQRTGRPKEAETLQREAVETSTRVQGEKHPRTIDALSSLGVLCRLQSRFPEAEATARRVLALRREVLGEDHPETIKATNELAITLDSMDRHKEAEPLFLDALERTRRLAGPEAPITLERMNNVATNYWFEGRFDEAARIYEQVVDISKRTQGEDSEDTVFAMNNLSVMYAKLGRLDEAQALAEKGLESRTKRFGPDHRLTLDSLASVADVAYKRARWADVEKQFTTLLAGRRKALGPDDPLTLETWENLGLTQWSLGRKAEADKTLSAALERRRAVLGSKHVQTLDSLQDLARLRVEMGRTDDARPLLVEAIAGRRAAAAATDATPAELQACARLLLTCALVDLRDPREALGLAKRANELTKDQDPEALRTLALAWNDNGNRSLAVTTQRRAIDLLPKGSADRAEYEKELAGYKKTD